jgi:hypothetical protein
LGLWKRLSPMYQLLTKHPKQPISLLDTHTKPGCVCQFDVKTAAHRSLKVTTAVTISPQTV